MSYLQNAIRIVAAILIVAFLVILVGVCIVAINFAGTQL